MLHFLSTVRTCALVFLSCMANHASAQTKETEPKLEQNLLELIHTPEVQRELGLDDKDQLQAVLSEIDRNWWPSRNLSPTKQIELTRDLEIKLLDALKPMLSPEKQRRLREIEAQSFGNRILIHPDHAKTIGLTEQQKAKIKTAFLATDSAVKKLSEKKGGSPELEKLVQTAREEEQTVLSETLTPANRQSISKLIGEPFDTMSLKRIYPLAPELIDSGEWVGPQRLTLKSLRGKVILVHFYAFQCHNCVANFDHYNRWQQSLSAKGVAMIGIQTPETPDERNPKLVKQAAIAKGFKFPVLIDLKNANWIAWGNTMWPTVYVIDKNGYVRSWWQGELNWQGATGDKTIEKVVDELLAEKE